MSCDLLIAGGGAGGIMAAIQAVRIRPGLDVCILERRPRPGAKVLVSGGGRCNIGNRRAEAGDFNSASPTLLAKVLRSFPASEALDFFTGLGLPLVEEGSGRMYPASQRASDVLEALLAETRRLGIEWRCQTMLEAARPVEEGWLIRSSAGSMACRRLILATGGQSLPKSGSDGNGLRLARLLGLRVIEPVVPALSPLALPVGHSLLALQGLACPVALRCPPSGRRHWHGRLLITHFGLSGPVVLDASRHVLTALSRDGTAHLLVDWLPQVPEQTLLAMLAAPSGARRVTGMLQEWLPARLASTLAAMAGLAEDLPLARLSRLERRALVTQLKASALPVAGPRSWNHAETTAGGVALDELDPATMEARSHPGLHLCGELIDVDGRLGGFNFQWAWSSGAVAGRAAAILSHPGAESTPRT